MDQLDPLDPQLPPPIEEGNPVPAPVYEPSTPPPSDPWQPIIPPQDPRRQDQDAPVFPNY